MAAGAQLVKASPCRCFLQKLSDEVFLDVGCRGDLFAAIIAKSDAEVRDRNDVTHQYSLWLGHVETVRATGKQRSFTCAALAWKRRNTEANGITWSALNDIYKLFHVVPGQLRFFCQAPGNGVHRRNAKTFDE